MTFEDEMNDMRLDSEETPPPEESGNRTFLIVAGILGAITVVTLVCIVVYAMYYLPRREGQQATQVAQVNAQNTAMAQAITQTSVAAASTAVPTKSEEQKNAREYLVASGDSLDLIAKQFGVTIEDLMRLNRISDPNSLQVGMVIYIPNPPTATASPTPLLAVPTDTPVPTDDPRTATVAALLTQAAIAQQTAVPTSTALPSTGFADVVGIPGLLGMALLLVVVIFLARRLRSA